jgi:hypothetical protein
MKDEHDVVWRWSAAFTEVVKRSIGEPPYEAAARADWPDAWGWLRWWWRDIDEARDLYQRECPERLRSLYDY